MKTSTTTWLTTLALAVAVGACGPSTPAAETPAEHGEHGEHHGEHHEHGGHGEHGEHHGHESEGEHAKLTGSVAAFHEVLAPLWHADKGPAREKKTCEAVPTFEQRAAAVDGEVPEAAKADAAGWHSAAQALAKSVGDLKAECGKPEGGRADFEAKFHGVHEAFHGIAERAGARH